MQIKKVIEDHGKSWASVAKDMGKTSSAIIQIADGNPTVGKLKQLAGVIGCHWLDFFQDELEAEGLQLVKSEQQEPAPQPQEKVEAAAEDTSDSNNEKCGGAAPKEGAEQGAASTGAAPEAPNQRAEDVRAVRFQYGCPHCGHQIQVCISEV